MKKIFLNIILCAMAIVMVSCGGTKSVFCDFRKKQKAGTKAWSYVQTFHAGEVDFLFVRRGKAAGQFKLCDSL